MKLSHSSGLLCLAVYSLISQAWGGSSGWWSAWSECSKSCRGEQNRKWQCSVGSTCDNKPKETRVCNAHGCLTQEMWIAIAAIGGAVVLLLVILLIICIRRHQEKKLLQQKNKRYPDMVEEMYDKSVNGSKKRRQSFQRFPSQKEHIVEETEVSKTEEAPSFSPHHHNKDTDSEVDGEEVSRSFRSYSESIQEAQVIFGPDEPGELDHSLESSSMTASSESESSDDNDDSPDVPRVEIIYSKVRK